MCAWCVRCQHVQAYGVDVDGWSVTRAADVVWRCSSMDSAIMLLARREDYHAGANEHDGDLLMWDVSRVTDMINLFKGASSFAGTLR